MIRIEIYDDGRRFSQNLCGWDVRSSFFVLLTSRTKFLLFCCLLFTVCSAFDLPLWVEQAIYNPDAAARKTTTATATAAEDEL